MPIDYCLKSEFAPQIQIDTSPKNGYDKNKKGSDTMQDIKALYALWLEQTKNDPDLHAELVSIEGKDDEILDRFYRCLEFGTAGLRGVIGAGTNRMNIYTVNQATQGLASYLLDEFQNPNVAIAYDSRICSDVFAKSAAGVLRIDAFGQMLFKKLVPVLIV